MTRSLFLTCRAHSSLYARRQRSITTTSSPDRILGTSIASRFSTSFSNRKHSQPPTSRTRVVTIIRPVISSPKERRPPLRHTECNLTFAWDADEFSRNAALPLCLSENFSHVFETRGVLRKVDLKLNRIGTVVSIKASAAAKRNGNLGKFLFSAEQKEPCPPE
jgi:hypothetical protein